MSRYLIFVAIFGALGGGPVLAAPSNSDAEILKIENGMAAAQTVDSFTAAWDNDVVLYDMMTNKEGVNEYVGKDAVLQDMRPQFATVFDIEDTIRRISIRADDELGFAYSVQHFHAKNKDGSPDLDWVFYETDCFEKKEGEWKLVHIQLTMPFDPAIGKAVLHSDAANR